MDLKVFKQLFVHRADIYSVQSPKGMYFPVKEEIDDEIINAHLKGEQTVGLYQLIPIENTIKWAVLDIDVIKDVWNSPDFKLDEWEEVLWEQAQAAQALLSKFEIPSYIEHSGHKGYHVWMFFEHPVDAGAVKEGLENIFSSLDKVHESIEWEIFPKQSDLPTMEDMGNLVKGPNGFHHKSKKFSKFIDELNLDTMKYAKLEQFSTPDTSFLQIVNRCRALKNSWDNCLTQKTCPNYLREVFGYLFINAGEDAEEYFVKEFLSKLHHYDAKTTEYHLKKMRDKVRADKQKGYLPITCKKLQSSKYNNVCEFQCKEIGTANSPIAFYHWAKGENLAEDNSTSKLSFVFQSGTAYYERMPAKKDQAPSTRQISSFIVNLNEVKRVADGLHEKTLLSGDIINENREEKFCMTAEDYSNPNEFRAYVTAVLGPNQLLMDNIITIQHAVQKYSEAKDITVLKQFGYNNIPKGDLYPKVYRTPSVLIDKDGVRENDEIIISLADEQFSCDLDMCMLSDEEFEIARESIGEDLIRLSSFEVSHTAIGHAYLPIIFPFLGSDETRYLFFVRGQTGRGKSYFVNMLQTLYGNFKTVASWRSTANSIGRIGYFFKDAIFAIDDFKQKNMATTSAYNAALGLMQNFADNTTRSRMNASLGIAKTYVIRGWIMFSGEDTPAGEASNLSRMFMVNLDGTYERDLDLGKKIQGVSKYYPGFTARYIHHILNQNPVLLEKTYDDFLRTYYAIVEGQSNDIRISRNVALLSTSYKYLSEFLWSRRKAKDFQERLFEHLKEKVQSLVTEAAAELASDRFLKILNELISSGRLRLQADSIMDVDQSPAPIVGFWSTIKGSSEPTPSIIFALAYNEVSRSLRSAGSSLDHSQKAILTELYEEDKIYDSKLQIRKFNKASVRVVRVKPGILTTTD
jgi:hypothetical protein